MDYKKKKALTQNEEKLLCPIIEKRFMVLISSIPFSIFKKIETLDYSVFFKTEV